MIFGANDDTPSSIEAANWSGHSAEGLFAEAREVRAADAFRCSLQRRYVELLVGRSHPQNQIGIDEHDRRDGRHRSQGRLDRYPRRSH